MRSETRADRVQRAYYLLGIGCTQTEVAKKIGVTRKTINQWAKKKSTGVKNFASAGRPSKLTPSQWVKIESALVAGPVAIGLKGKYWKVRHAHDYVVQVLQIPMAQTTVWHILDQLGLTRKSAKAKVRSAANARRKKKREEQGGYW